MGNKKNQCCRMSHLAVCIHEHVLISSTNSFTWLEGGFTKEKKKVFYTDKELHILNQLLPLGKPTRKDQKDKSLAFSYARGWPPAVPYHRPIHQ